MLKGVKWCLALLLFMVIPTMSDAQTDNIPTDSVHHDAVFEPPTPAAVINVPRLADSVVSKPSADTIQLAGPALVRRCHESRTADIRFFAIQAISGRNYDAKPWGSGGFGLGVTLLHKLRVGGDLYWTTVSGRKRIGTFVVSVTHLRHIGKSWSASIADYAGPSFSSRESDNPLTGLSGNLSLYKPNELSQGQYGALVFFVEPFYESEGRVGLRLGFGRMQPH
ncbi:MAG: hypothetical protein V1685_05890 [Parcubacteria group bacterium]